MSEAPNDGAAHGRTPQPGAGAFRTRLAEILRVDHAGELAAVHIYQGQRAVFQAGRGHERIAAQLAHMEAQEQHHYDTFCRLLTEHQVRPTVMTPLWRLAALGLGVGTALMGEKAAHACTEAVETVIEGHYAGQIAEMVARDPDLTKDLAAFRDDEIEHRDTAVEQGARQAPAYPLLSAVIRAGCQLAIKVSEKI